MNVLVVGAGIGGAAAAIALRRAGFEVTVCERAPEPREVGAGISIWGNAIAALRRIDAAEPVLAAGHRMHLGELRTDRGRVLSRADVGAMDERPGEPSIIIHRADLLDGLLAQLPAGTVRFARTLTAWRTEGDGAGDRVVASFETGEEIAADLLVGADGINSTVRRLLRSGEPGPRYAGYTCWRGLCDFPESRWPAGRICEAWGRGERFGITRLGGGPAAVNGRGRLYWFALANTPRGWTCPDHRAELRRRFGGWFDPVPDILDATPAESIIQSDIFDRPMARGPGGRRGRGVWCDDSGRAVLIGDAAHPTTPNLGQGACMAIEDAVGLADLLGAHRGLLASGDPPGGAVGSALLEFVRLRHGRCRGIVNTSRLLGRMAHTESAVLAAARNGFMRRSGPLTAIQHRRVTGYRLPEVGGGRGRGALG